MAPKKEAVPQKTKHELLMEEVAGLEIEAVKVYEKGNKAAGARYRKHLSAITALCKQARAETLELANG